MKDNRTTEQILRDARTRAGRDRVAGRVAAQELARRHHQQRLTAEQEQEILNARETASDRASWYDADR